jgi:hypothetical protein
LNSCPACHHIFLDQKAVADHLWAKCKEIKLQTSSVCIHHSTTKGVVESPHSKESSLEQEQLIHRGICYKSSLTGILDDVDWNDVWVRNIWVDQ